MKDFSFRNDNRFVILLFTILSILQISCSKEYLDRPPLTQISNNSYWRTSTDLENYMLQFYTAFPSFNAVGSHLGLIGWDGTRGSDVEISASPSTIWNGTQQPITSGGNWTWNNIRNINVFFENYQKCQDPYSEYKQFLGEAHFFKAWFYFEKVKAYGDVPWYTNSLDMTSKDLYKARDSRLIVIDSILWNLDEAVKDLNSLNEVKGGNNRLSKEAALLFKSRVALFEGSWQKYHSGDAFGTPNADPNKYFKICVDASEELMSGKYRVGLYSTGDSEGDYCRLFSLVDQSSNSEVILWKGYSRDLQLSHSFQIYVSDRTAGISMTLQQICNYLRRDGSTYDYLSLGKLVKGSDFLEKIGQDCDPRLSQTVWTPGKVMWDNSFGKSTFSLPYLDQSGESLNNTGFQIRKGNDPKDPQAGSGSSWNTSCQTGAIIFRYAEVLLNYAEAKAELNESVDYDNSINLLRTRSGMPKFIVQGDPNRSFYADFGYPLSDELYEIRRERCVELGAEGFRYDDIRRWGASNLVKGKKPLGYPFKPSEWSGITINYKTTADGFLDPFVKQLPEGYGFKEERDYLECIPLNEITLNENLKQNPGW